MFCFYLSKKISHDISCKLSAKQTIHIKCHDLFSLIFFLLECYLLQIFHLNSVKFSFLKIRMLSTKILLGTLSVKGC